MILFFKRGPDVVRLETRIEPVTAEYGLIIMSADNRETIEVVRPPMKPIVTAARVVAGQPSVMPHASGRQWQSSRSD